MTAQTLADVLGAQPPAAIAKLPVRTQERLAAQILQARRVHRELGEQSVQEAVAGVPLAVRGIVRKALLG